MDDDAHQWLKATGQLKQLRRSQNLGCLYPGLLWFSAVVSVGLAISNLGFIWMPFVFAALAVASRKVSRHLFENAIFCPHCGYNPTRRKSDGRPRLDRDKVGAQLWRYDVCPECGETGDAQPDA